METLPEELYSEILKYLSPQDYPRLWIINRQWYQIICQQLVSITNDTIMKHCINTGDILSILLSNYSYRNLKYICQGNHFPITKLLIDRGANQWIVDEILTEDQIMATQESGIDNDKEISPWNKGLYEACRRAHLEMAKLMIAKGANSFNTAFKYACQGGSWELIMLMRKYYFDRPVTTIEDINYFYVYGLHGAASGGHLTIIKRLLDLYPGNPIDSWNICLYFACKGGHNSVVNYILETYTVRVNFGLTGACTGNQSELIKMMVDLGANLCTACPRSVNEHLKKK